jgi:thiosulfate dehydrogenase [quinone] large subunit
MGDRATRWTEPRRDPGWILLPLRAYLAFAFLYAGLSKIADRDFLDSRAATSMHATLLAVKDQSPIGGLLGPVEHHAFAFGLLMALGEIAVGIGVLAGLFTRIAAAGGLLISLSLWLTVSWNADPWYTGADIVYAFALTPLLLGGAGPLSADAWLAGRAAAAPAAGDRTRRVVLGGIAGAAGLLAVGLAALFRKDARSAPAASKEPAATEPASSAPTSAPPTSSGTAAGGIVLVSASRVPVGGAVSVKDPKSGRDVYVLQLEKGRFTALDRTCPHQGCPVSFESKSAGFVCPCHQSRFDATGRVTQGPATSGLAKIPVHESGSNVVRG